MKKNIKTMWQGKIAVHEKYIAECKKLNQSFTLVYIGRDDRFRGQSMVIPFSKLDSGKVGKEKYPERNTIGTYSLIYFKWKPDVDTQQKLL